MLRELRPLLPTALGHEQLVVPSTSIRLDEVHDRSVSHASIGPFDLFDRIEYLRVDGELVAQFVEARVVRDGVLVELIRVGPFDQLEVWVGDEQLREWVDAVVSALTLPPADLLDPSRDLIGVDLGVGRLAASEGFGSQWVEWDVTALDVGEVSRLLRTAVPALFAAAGLGAPPDLESRRQRTWNPIDGAQPPYCRFTDTIVDEGAADGIRSARRLNICLAGEQ